MVMIPAGLDSDAVGLQNESSQTGRRPNRMHALVCLGSRLRGQGCVTSSIHMLKLPSVLIRTDLPHWTFLTIKGITRQKTNGFSSPISWNSVADGAWVLQSRPDEGGGA